MDALTVYLDGIGVWTPGIADWAAMRRTIDGDADSALQAASRPSPAVLPPTERRRAPEPVLIASEVAGQACAMAQRDPAAMPCVFASTHGDIAITDAMCTTLAAEPRELSPTRFHNSVHNAPAGYWTVATRCHAAATAISASLGSFAAGLLEAAVEACAESAPVLLCAYDIASQGPLVDVAPSTLPFAVAFVLSPSRSAVTLAALAMRTSDARAEMPAPPASLAPLAGNPTAQQAVPLLVAIARRTASRMTLALGRDSALAVEVSP